MRMAGDQCVNPHITQLLSNRILIRILLRLIFHAPMHIGDDIFHALFLHPGKNLLHIIIQRLGVCLLERIDQVPAVFTDCNSIDRLHAVYHFRLIYVIKEPNLNAVDILNDIILVRFTLPCSCI